MIDLPQLNLPPAALHVREPLSPGGRASVLCLCRRRYVALTPEEWVRQNFISLLVTRLGYPQGLVAAEVPVDVNGLRQRADIVVFSRQMRPLVIVECKAPHITLSQVTLNQACRYLSAIDSVAVALTNGVDHYCVTRAADGSARFLQHIPTWDEVNALGAANGAPAKE